DPDASGGNSGTRLAQVASLLDTGLIDRLREKHDVTIYRFDQNEAPVEIASLDRTKPLDAGETAEDVAAKQATAAAAAKRLIYIAAGILLLALLALVGHLILGRIVRNEDGESWALLVAIFCLIVAGVFYSVSNLRYPEVGWRQVFLGEPISTADDTDEESTAESENESTAPPTNWQAELIPRGVETRLGDSIQYVIDKERGGPIAGITIFTDGNSNAGIDYRDAIATAQQAEVPVHLVGVGSEKRPANVRVVDVESPPRVYPGDQFNIQGFVQAYGLKGTSAKVELLAQPVENGKLKDSPTLEDEQIVTLMDDGEVNTVKFDVTPKELGTHSYTIRVSTSGQDLDKNDNEKANKIEVVDRKNKVLLIAGGPTREYRFVRDLCYRDKDVTVDVWLQSSPPGAAQESNELLDEFPTDITKVFEYDAIVAFDPDWESVPEESIELLERWVAEKSGGLLLVGGPVFMPEWTALRRDTRAIRTLKGLYPVTFYSRTVMRLARGKINSDLHQLDFTDQGRQSRCLWLDDSSLRSEEIWDAFDGVYATFPVRGTKPGATVLANLDRRADENEAPAILIAEQFYGAGRVVYIGSGEFWRLRTVDVAHFETLYTKLIRHVSQGRLLRNSTRGVLMVGKDRCVLGDSVAVRSTLSDSQFRPLELESVQADLVSPSGNRQPLELRAIKEANRAGNYAGQFTAIEEGDYRVELVIPESNDLEFLTREVKVRVPELEVESPQRNDAILNEIAQTTGGTYFAGLGELQTDSLEQALIPQDQETYLPGTPDRKF
ncbi:MAG: vWA domain-containing protein, partial [Planctomycetota bacterium]